MACPRWRLEVQYRNEAAEYKAILKKYAGAEEDAQVRAFLYKNGQPTEYCIAYYQIKAYEKKIPVEYQRDYITWFTDLKLTEKPDYYPDKVAYYEDDWFLMKNEDYYYDVYVRDPGEMIVLEEGEFDLPEDQREKVMEDLRAKRHARAEQSPVVPILSPV